MHPATLDVITGCSDGFVRIFSKNPATIASEEERDEFEKSSELAAVQASEQMSNDAVKKLPDVS